MGPNTDETPRVSREHADETLKALEVVAKAHRVSAGRKQVEGSRVTLKGKDLLCLEASYRSVTLEGPQGEDLTQTFRSGEHLQMGGVRFRVDRVNKRRIGLLPLLGSQFSGKENRSARRRLERAQRKGKK